MIRSISSWIPINFSRAPEKTEEESCQVKPANPVQKRIRSSGSVANRNRYIRDRSVKPAGDLTIYFLSGHVFVRLRDDADHSEITLGKYDGALHPPVVNSSCKHSGNYCTAKPSIKLADKLADDTVFSKLLDYSFDPIQQAGEYPLYYSSAVAGSSCIAGPWNGSLLKTGLSGIYKSAFSIIFGSALCGGTGGFNPSYCGSGTVSGVLNDDKTITLARGIQLDEIPSMRFSLGSDQVAHLKEWLEQQKQNPDNYNIFTQNCFSFAEDAVNEAGFNGHISDYCDRDWNHKSGTKESIIGAWMAGQYKSMVTGISSAWSASSILPVVSRQDIIDASRRLKNIYRKTPQPKSENEKYNSLKSRYDELRAQYNEYILNPGSISHNSNRYRLLRNIRKLQSELKTYTNSVAELQEETPEPVTQSESS